MLEHTVKPNISIRNALKKINENGEKCLIIVNSKGNVIGTLSDGDIRRAILNGVTIETSIKTFYN